MEEEKNFFKFYEDGFTETRPMYEKIIEALTNAGYIPEEYIVRNEEGIIDKEATLDKVIDKCKELDQKEIKATNGQVKESNIGLYGFFKERFDEIRDEAKKTATKDEKIMQLDEKKRAEAIEKAGDKAVETYIMEMGEKALEGYPEDERVTKEEAQSHYEAKAFLGQLAVGPYFPRLTCTSASHFMGEGHIMQIGCSQGKTTVVAMTTYEQCKQGKKVYSTSSSPGLVPENYDEARNFYERMGVAEEFCAISQNANDNVNHIILFHNGKKYEVRADGEIWGDPEKKSEEYTVEDLEDLGLVIGEDGKFDFEESVRKMLDEKHIIMGDTITLGQYQHLMKREDGVIPNSFLIVDEADAELLDTQPQEILGKEYQGSELEDRWEYREKARDIVVDYKGELSGLEELANKNGIPLGFVLDAYEAKCNYNDSRLYEVRDGKVFILNPSTNVMIPASQGLAQAILANDESLEYIPEREVLGETDIPKLFSNFEVASLMSGTMQDKGLSQEKMTEEYKNARMYFLEMCGRGVASSAEQGVIDWKLVTPMTREEKGSVVVTRNGIERIEEKDTKVDIQTKPESIEIDDWETFLEEHGEEFEEQWRKAVSEEAIFRSKSGKPVMVSVYGNRNPIEGLTDPVSGEEVRNYTDKDQIAKDGDIHKIGNDKCLYVRDGIGEIATFDDFYGRGYTFKFAKMDSNGNPEKKEGKEKPVKTDAGGHVLITSLPQNSRNLEQFLFRVARGGDKGSSSIIISPKDPILVDYLKKLEAEHGKEKANAYLRGVINGEIKVDQIVTDIYPKETEKIFIQKAELAGVRKTYDEAGQEIKIDDVELAEAYKMVYSKEMVSHMKYYRTCGVPEDDVEVYKRAGQLQLEVVKKLVELGLVTEPEKIMKILPKGLPQEIVEELIHQEDDRENVEEINDKAKTNAPGKENIGREEVGRSLIGEIPEAAKTDDEYNIDTTRQALNAIKQAREQQELQQGQENER